MKMEVGVRKKKKREILGGPAEGGPGLRGPLAKIGLVPPKSAQIGQVKRGHFGPPPLWPPNLGPSPSSPSKMPKSDRRSRPKTHPCQLLPSKENVKFYS